MERNFTNENMEEFLKQNAEGLRMLPSDKVWQGISSHFKKQRRRFGLLVGIGLVVTTATGYYIVDQTLDKEKATAQTVAASINNQASTSQKQQASPFNDGKTNDPVDQTLAKTVVPFHQPVKEQDYLALVQSNETTGNLPTVIENAGADEPSTSISDPRNFTSTIIDDTYPVSSGEKEKRTTQNTVSNSSDPLTIESVFNSYSRKKSKIGLQVYFSPTVSYRKLRENTSYIKSISPNNIPSTQQNLYDINEFVTHKPAFGFELGLAAKYPVSKNLKLRAGFQFNVNRYDIKVFNSATQVATIRFNSRNRADSLTQNTNYSNTNGYKSNWLENFYFQVSAPVGVEFKLKGDEKIEFGVASTVQPTYVLGDRAYVISTDYKNYAEVPWLIRRWNVNTSLETYVAYSTGKLKWQVGPQVRYQMLSSFVKKYPVKENLFDFGLKVGIGLKQ
ncbi:MAG TPA: hypothetical protein VGC29_02805 [Flavisolibacter sp.]